MDTKNIVCNNCGLNMEYWTKADFINCTKCGELITVEPCEDEVIEIIGMGNENEIK